MASVQHVSRSMQDHQGEDRGPTLQSFLLSPWMAPELAPCHIQTAFQTSFSRNQSRIEMAWLACFFRVPLPNDERAARHCWSEGNCGGLSASKYQCETLLLSVEAFVSQS